MSATQTKSTDRNQVGGGRSSMGLLGLLVFTIAGSLSLKWIFHLDWVITGVAVMFSLFAFAKLSLPYVFTSGHGVMKRKWQLFGLSIVFWAILGVIVFLCAGIIYSGFHINGQTGNNVISFGIAGLIGVVASLMYWFLWGYGLYYYGSEYDARVALKQAGHYDDHINILIDDLRKDGVIR